MYMVKIGKRYIVKEGELKLNDKGQFVDGAALALDVKLATVFDTIKEACLYQSVITIKGKRGQIVRVK